jgi:hypothetical protein
MRVTYPTHLNNKNMILIVNGTIQINMLCIIVFF